MNRQNIHWYNNTETQHKEDIRILHRQNQVHGRHGHGHAD